MKIKLFTTILKYDNNLKGIEDAVNTFLQKKKEVILDVKVSSAAEQPFGMITIVVTYDGE